MLSIKFSGRRARRPMEMDLLLPVIANDWRRYFPRAGCFRVFLSPLVEQKMSTFRSGIVRAALLEWRAQGRILFYARCAI